MRRIAGLDLNGWRDFAVRDTPFEEEEPADGDASPPGRGPWRIDGGVAGVVVDMSIGTEIRVTEQRFVGGPQALISPIGRGGGWGKIGNPGFRTPIRHLLDEVLDRRVSPDLGDKLRAAAEALTMHADDVVAVVPDVAALDDDGQEALLRALRRKGVTTRLLWRPVAVLLTALEDGHLASPREGLRVACLNHAADGIELQVLTLRRLSDHAGLYAPQRDRCGSVRPDPDALDRLRAAVERRLAAANPEAQHLKHEPSRLPVRMLLEDEATSVPEVLRADNGTWLSMRAPGRGDLVSTGRESVFELADTDLALFTSPLAAPLRDELAARLRAAIDPVPLAVLPSDAAARGALLAGRRIEHGIPHYLDRLDQVSLVVLGDDDVVLEDLVPKDAIVPANKEYQSEAITGLGWPAGAQSVTFYIQKSGEFRRWRTGDVVAPAEPKRVEIRLKQIPAQGRAQLFITSTEWDELRRRPLFLDWATLERDTRSFEEIADELRPVVPDRLTTFTHLARWQGGDRIPAFEPFILGFSVTAPGAIGTLGRHVARALGVEIGRSPDGTRIMKQARLVDFDGNVPEGVDPRAVAAFDAALKRIADLACLSARKGASLSTNDYLKAATWAFGRCPESLQDEMIRAAEAHLAGRTHPFLAPKAAARVLLHGLGRVVTAPDRLARTIDLLTAHWRVGNVRAALASLLTRPISTPDVLDEQRTLSLARIAGDMLEALKRDKSFGTNLKYALNLVGGLLRCRRSRPMALLRGRSLEANRLYGVLSEIRKLLGVQSVGSAQRSAKLAIIDDLVDMLEGSGGRATILVAIDELVDDEDDPASP